MSALFFGLLSNDSLEICCSEISVCRTSHGYVGVQVSSTVQRHWLLLLFSGQRWFLPSSLLTLADNPGGFALLVHPVRVYMMTQIRFRSLENHLEASLVFPNRSNSQTHVGFKIHSSTPKAPPSGIPFGWQYFIMRAFVLAVTVTGFDPLLWMPSVWLTWQALSRLQVSGAFSDHCCPCPGRCQNRHSAHLSLGTALASNCPSLKSQLGVNTRCQGTVMTRNLQQSHSSKLLQRSKQDKGSQRFFHKSMAFLLTHAKLSNALHA